MRKIMRAIAVGALAVPLVTGAAGAAFADGDNGTGGNGNSASFEQSSIFAGPKGAGSQKTESNVDLGGDNYGENGSTSFEKSQTMAGPEGAFAQSTESNVNGH